MTSAERFVLERATDALPPYADAKLGRLIAYWRARRAGDALPTHDAIDPLDLAPILPNLFLLDVEDRSFRFRLVGEALNARYPGGLKDRRLDDLLSGEVLAETLEEHRLCVERRAPVFTRNSEESRSVQGDFQVYQRLLLPLSADGEAVDAILGAMHFDGG